MGLNRLHAQRKRDPEQRIFPVFLLQFTTSQMGATLASRVPWNLSSGYSQMSEAWHHGVRNSQEPEEFGQQFRSLSNMPGLAAR